MATSNNDFTRLIKFGVVALGILAAFLALESISVVKSLGVPDPTYNSISVIGTAKATSTPDIATFSFSVSADASDATAAQSNINSSTAKIVADLKALGI